MRAPRSIPFQSWREALTCSSIVFNLLKIKESKKENFFDSVREKAQDGFFAILLQRIGVTSMPIEPIDILRRFALTVAILMLGLWGVSLLLFPSEVSAFFTNEPVNYAFAGMTGASLLGLSFISFARVTKWVSARRALGIAMLLLVVESVYLMLGAGVMLVTGPTSISLVAAAAVAFFLLI